MVHPAQNSTPNPFLTLPWATKAPKSSKMPKNYFLISLIFLYFFLGLWCAGLWCAMLGPLWVYLLFVAPRVRSIPPTPDLFNSYYSMLFLILFDYLIGSKTPNSLVRNLWRSNGKLPYCISKNAHWFICFHSAPYPSRSVTTFEVLPRL